MTIKSIIIDDEPSSQTVLKQFISKVDFLELSGTCNNAIEAIELLNRLDGIDLLFLDINMPRISGLTFYKSLQNPPHVIFTTAYSQYAIEGFDVNATDYLLKPFSFERFLTAVNKVTEKKWLKENKNVDPSHLLIKSNKVLHKILFDTIQFIEARGDYVKIYYLEKSLLTNNTFSNILELLPSNMFIRTHKSFAVNLQKINSVSSNKVVIEEHSIPVGQKYKSEFIKFLKQNH